MTLATRKNCYPEAAHAEMILPDTIRLPKDASPQTALVASGNPWRERSARKRALKAQGITPAKKQRAWCVQVAREMLAPHWWKAKAIKGLTPQSGWVWLRPRDAKRLIRQHQRQGLMCSVLKSEFKRCELCQRPLLSTEAEQRRRVMESSGEGRSLPCSANCKQEQDCNVWPTAMALQQENYASA